MRIILPKTFCEVDPTYGPVFFLAGPIRGGDDWQAKCCAEIQQFLPNFYAVVPSHYNDQHWLWKYRVEGSVNHFPRQLNWERYYLELASNLGCIIFWLPAESKINPRGGTDPYAMDTRGELGEWRGRLMSDPKRIGVVVGAEMLFPGRDQIKRNFSLAIKSEFHIWSTLENTVGAAVRHAKEYRAHWSL